MSSSISFYSFHLRSVPPHILELLVDYSRCQLSNSRFAQHYTHVSLLRISRLSRPSLSSSHDMFVVFRLRRMLGRVSHRIRLGKRRSDHRSLDLILSPSSTHRSSSSPAYGAPHRSDRQTPIPGSPKLRETARKTKRISLSRRNLGLSIISRRS